MPEFLFDKKYDLNVSEYGTSKHNNCLFNINLPQSKYVHINFVIRIMPEIQHGHIYHHHTSEF